MATIIPLNNGERKHYGTAPPPPPVDYDQDHIDRAREAPMYLYISHFVSTFDDRLWQFAVPIMLMDVWKETLFPAAAVTFTTNIVTCIVMPYVGAWSDSQDRMKVLGISIFGESCSIIIAAFLLYCVAAVSEDPDYPVWTLTETVLFTLLCLANAATEISMRIGQQSLEKDWVVVIANILQESTAEMNRNMRTIDLGCKLLGPACFGLFVQLSAQSPLQKLANALLLLVIWNVIVIPLEYYTVSRVYNSVPTLGVKNIKTRQITNPVSVLIDGWKSYWRHPVSQASIAYGLLWFTVLDNGVLMTSYLKWLGIPEGPLGISRGIGAMFGIIGTWLHPVIVRRLSDDSTSGLLFVWMFWLLLLPIGASFMFYGTTQTSAIVMIVSVTVSRALLWCFDLTIQKLLQDTVQESERGVVNSVHTAVTQLMLVCVSISGMFFPEPTEFATLVSISLLSVLLSCIAYTTWFVSYEHTLVHY